MRAHLAPRVSRGLFIMSGSGFLAACSGAVNPAIYGPPGGASSTGATSALVGLTPEMMLKQGILAVSQDGQTIVRPDSISNADLMTHLKSLPSVNSSTSRSPEDQSATDCENAEVGQNCGPDNLPKIGSTSAPNFFNTTFSGVISGGFFSFQTVAQLPAEQFLSPRYTIPRIQLCATTVPKAFATNMTQIAESFIGGALSAYITPGSAQASALGGASRALISGSVSSEAFFDVLAAVTTSVTLPEILGSIGLGLTVSLAGEFAHCLFTGSP